MIPVRALIEGSPQAAVSTPAETSVSDSAGVILVANAKRKGVIVQNTGTTILYLAFGSTNPTATAYHVALKASTGANDGTGGVYMDDACTLTLRALSSAAGGKCVITEFTTGTPDWSRAGDYGMQP
jgi:hypothetical protein